MPSLTTPGYVVYNELREEECNFNSSRSCLHPLVGSGQVSAHTLSCTPALSLLSQPRALCHQNPTYITTLLSSKMFSYKFVAIVALASQVMAAPTVVRLVLFSYHAANI